MTVTPQSIRDTEFQVKLKGYDKVEVRTCLDQIAEEYLGLMEQLEIRDQNLETMTKHNNELLTRGSLLSQKFSEIRETIGKLKIKYQYEKKRSAKQHRDNEGLQVTVGQLRSENNKLAKKLGLADIHLKELSSGLALEKSRSSKMHERLRLLEEQNHQGQKDAENLRGKLKETKKYSEEMMEESERQASEIFNRVRKEIAQIRAEAKKELAYYPAEIKRMREEHARVKEQLLAIAQKYVDGLTTTLADAGELLEEEQVDAVQDPAIVKDEQDGQAKKRYAAEAGMNADNSAYLGFGVKGRDELFQSITISEDMSLSSEQLDAISRDMSFPFDMDD